MSKARLVITAVVLEGRSVSQTARDYGVSKGWVSKLVARYQAEGESAFTPRSRRPHTSPRAIPASTAALITELREKLSTTGLDAGPDTIAWHLRHHHGLSVSVSTISRYLTKAGLVTAQPKKKPKSSYIRFAAEQPNETWQSDFTHYRLTNTDGTPGADTEIISWLDDHSRAALSVSAWPAITGAIVVTTFLETAATHDFPASTLTDNGLVYTARFSFGGRGGRNGFEELLRTHNIVQKNSRPNHPTTCGKAERFQQTLKKWLRAQPNQPATITELQTLLDTFTNKYNHHRPHRSLPRRATPATIYQARPKATPAQRTPTTHERVRRDRVDDAGSVTLRVNGRLHHIGVGRTHARTHILMLIQDLNVRIINAATGEILRDLTINTTKDYQPQNQKRTEP